MGDIYGYYNSYSENERLNRRRSRNLERITTMRYLEPYLANDKSLADIGCGTGAYCFELAARTKSVTAIDLIERHIAQVNERIAAEKTPNLRAFVASATDLSLLETASFDVAICLGPFYHLQKADERRRCLDECSRILRQGGILAASYINKQATVSYFARNRKHFSRELVQALEDDDYKAFSTFDDFLSISYCTDPGSIESEAARSGFSIVKNLAADGVSYFISEQLEEMDDSQWKAYVEYHLRHCEDESTLGMSSHGLLICRKA
jgi:ubiquinone/menaquinone biosynthesis C-methylase UbiE